MKGLSKVSFNFNKTNMILLKVLFAFSFLTCFSYLIGLIKITIFLKLFNKEHEPGIEIVNLAVSSSVPHKLMDFHAAESKNRITRD